MAVVLDTATSTFQLGNSDITLSHTCTGSDLLLLVGIAHSAGDLSDVSGVTYNSVPMTRLSSINNSDSSANIRSTIYYLVAPSVGANNIVVSISGPPCAMNVIGASFTGVDQSTPLGTAATSTTNNSTTPSVTVSSASGELVFDIEGAHNTITTFTADNTKIKEQIQASTCAAASTAPGAASVNMSWVLNPARWSAQVGVSIKPVSAPTAIVVQFREPTRPRPFAPGLAR